jgi:hypothetical protein
LADQISFSPLIVSRHSCSGALGGCAAASKVIASAADTIARSLIEIPLRAAILQCSKMSATLPVTPFL